MERFRCGRLSPHPDETHPRLYVDDFFQPLETQVPYDFFSELPSWPMSLNDQLGDCTIAGANHVQMAWNHYARQDLTPWPDSVVLAAYEAVGGYVPGDPATDRGCVMQDVLQHWRTEGIGGDRILFYGALRKWDRQTRLTALRNFGSLYTGINLPASAEDQFSAGQPWTPVPGSPLAGGHCVDQQGELTGADEVVYVSWGRPVRASMAFAMAVTEENWVVGSSDFIEVNGLNPDGIDLAGMNEALASLTGQRNPLGIRRHIATGWPGEK